MDIRGFAEEMLRKSEFHRNKYKTVRIRINYKISVISSGHYSKTNKCQNFYYLYRYKIRGGSRDPANKILSQLICALLNIPNSE